LVARVPDRPFREREAGAELLDLDVLVDELRELVGSDVYGHVPLLSRCLKTGPNLTDRRPRHPISHGRSGPVGGTVPVTNFPQAVTHVTCASSMVEPPTRPFEPCRRDSPCDGPSTGHGREGLGYSPGSKSSASELMQ